MATVVPPALPRSSTHLLVAPTPLLCPRAWATRCSPVQVGFPILRIVNSENLTLNVKCSSLFGLLLTLGRGVWRGEGEGASLQRDVDGSEEAEPLP